MMEGDLRVSALPQIPTSLNLNPLIYLLVAIAASSSPLQHICLLPPYSASQLPPPLVLSISSSPFNWTKYTDIIQSIIPITHEDKFFPHIYINCACLYTKMHNSCLVYKLSDWTVVIYHLGLARWLLKRAYGYTILYLYT